MKNIILLIAFFLAFSPLQYAQIVDTYVDQNNDLTTVIEKDASTKAIDVVNSLDIDSYGVGEVVFIKDASQLEQVRNTPAPAQTQNKVEAPKRVATRERNPIGNKVKRKRKRTPRWKSDRRAKRSSFACFEF